MSIVAVVLAAGASRRLGQPKQLLPYDGTTLIEAIVSRVCATRCTRVGVVVGARASEIERALASQPVELIDNPLWEEGIASSVRAGVSWAKRTMCEGLLVCAGDQPFLTTAHLERLLSRFTTHRPVGSRYRDACDLPAVFGRETFESLHALRGDRGVQRLLSLSNAAVVEWPDGEVDIDRPEDLDRMSASDLRTTLPGVEPARARTRPTLPPIGSGPHTSTRMHRTTGPLPSFARGSERAIPTLPPIAVVAPVEPEPLATPLTLPVAKPDEEPV